MTATSYPLLEGTNLARVHLGSGPTPVRRLDGLDAAAPVWLKDDGAYSRFSGNKARKLEWLLGDARRRGKKAVITGGALGTNHGLATALFARELEMETVLVLVPQPLDTHVERQLNRMRESGAEIHRAGGSARGFALAARLMSGRVMRGRGLPYLILPGGSEPRGCVGYVEAGLELGEQVRAGQIPEPSHIVLALGSGGTLAGLLVGLRLAGLRSRPVGVLVNDLTRVSDGTVARLARRTARFLRRHGADIPGLAISAGDLDVETGFLGNGYGHSTPEAERAIELLRPQGVTLEPVYTAKAMAALLALNERGEFGGGPVLYWHTYRVPDL
ncbi:MAG: pyridoxal-phosphate dependent enzyme [Actinomycetota bacterium]